MSGFERLGVMVGTGVGTGELRILVVCIRGDCDLQMSAELTALASLDDCATISDDLCTGIMDLVLPIIGRGDINTAEYCAACVSAGIF